MSLAGERPINCDELQNIDIDLVADLIYDWLAHRNRYTELELASMVDWIVKLKRTFNHHDNVIPSIDIGTLNRMQK